jgi:hypothetical protein
MSIFQESSKFFWRCGCQYKNVKYFTFEACSKCGMIRDMDQTVPLLEVTRKCPNYSAVIIGDRVATIAKEFGLLRLIIESFWGQPEEVIEISDGEVDLLYNNGDQVFKLVKLSKLVEKVA